jgi:CubicO group peptidase (beta-lactamase class C family)
VDIQALDRFIEDQRDKHRIPGITLAVFEDGQVTYAKGYGEADAGRPMAPEVAMPIGSISKPITAVAVLQLVEQRRLALDAPVQTYLPWFRVDDEAASQAITVRHLLYHTSGLSELDYMSVLPTDSSLEDRVRDLRRARPTAPVGTTHQYFNPNYATLALLIETVTGRSYADVVRTGIFEPLGMRSSYVRSSDLLDPAVAQGHVKMFGFPVAANPPFRPAQVGANHVVSTAPDLARFAAAIMNGGMLGSAQILTPASVTAMRTPPAIPGTTYAMGWDIGRHRTEASEGHTGADPTFLSQLAVLPETGRGYVLLMNNEHLLDAVIVTPQLWMGILDLLQGRPSDGGGISMKLVGALTLAVFALAVVLSGRSLWRLRGWAERSRSLSVGRLVRAIAPHVVVPVVVIVAAYQLIPLLLGGRGFNVREIGVYYLPDLLLLLALATIPDLAQGGYMLAAAVVHRRRRAAGIDAGPGHEFTAAGGQVDSIPAASGLAQRAP